MGRFEFPILPTAPASTKHLKNTALKTEAVSEESVKHQEEEKPLRIDPIETIIKEEHEHPTHREKKKIVDNSGGKNAPIKTPTNPLVLGFITIISALIMIAFGYILSEYQLFNSVGTFLAQDQQTEVVDETPDPTPEPTPAPTPEPIDFSIYTVRVLNGTGTAGEAGRAATQLESLGFEEITTGNAPSFSITQTTVRVKADVSPEVVQSILTELNNYSATTSAELQD